MPEIPHIIKYMGSKRNIIDFVVDTINEVRTERNHRLYDLFGGSAVVSGSFRNLMPVTCNDIQAYTKVLAGTYLKNYDWNLFNENVLEDILKDIETFISGFKNVYAFNFDIPNNITFQEQVLSETKQRDLINYNFNGFDHLFVKNFSGTYWSYEQCLYIDAIASVARSDKYEGTFLYNVILSSLMFAMAYTTQSTGHYAQYRDITSDNFSDILFYRKKELLPLFKQKFNSLKEVFNETNNHHFNHEFTNLDFLTALEDIEENSIIYADPPYQFVHYSRFYHALETLVKYDYPTMEHKGRYRNDRHQSPFCIRTKVATAFSFMFEKINRRHSTLVLSYSDNGMITLEELLTIAQSQFQNYDIFSREIDHTHSTMGRQKDKSRYVKESLLICRPN